MNKIFKAGLLIAIGGLFCQAQIVALPTRSKQSVRIGNNRNNSNQKKQESSFPTPSGMTSTTGFDHQLESTGNESMDRFRREIMGDLNNFRHTVLEHYADFLEGTWHEYEPLEGFKRYSQPKPSTITTVDGTPVEPSEETRKAKARRSWKIAGRQRPVLPDPAIEESMETPELGMDSKETNKWGMISQQKMDSTLKSKNVRNTVKDIEHGIAAMTRELPGDWLNFYELDVRVPTIDFSIADSISDLSRGTAAQWRALSADSVASRVIPELTKIKEQMNLNDYLTYELVSEYINSKFPKAEPLSRASAIHYLMTNMGFAVRLGYDQQSKIPYLLLPSKEKLYGRPRIIFNEHTYYFFSPTQDVDFYDNTNYSKWRFVSCGLPLEADNGEELSFEIQGLNIPFLPMEYEIEAMGMKLKGVTNEALYPFVARYPQMETDKYSSSFLDQEIRDDLVRQVKEQLAEKPKREALNTLLGFIQYGFDYKEDQAYHGFEKPYFIEENLYYPINDCEDRALLFTYLVWNALGVRNQLIAYPDHEAAAILSSEIGELDEEYISQLTSYTPQGYNYRGDDFYISDPTYIRSIIGDCMRQYRGTLPVIDRYFSK